MKKVKFMLLVLLILLFSGITKINSQVDEATFDWCERVTDNGKPIGSYTEFTCDNGDGGCYVYGLIHIPYVSRATEIIFEVYKYDNNGNEHFYTTYTYYNSNGDRWDWCYQKMYFYSSGKYICYVYTKQNYKYTDIGFAKVEWYFY